MRHLSLACLLCFGSAAAFAAQEPPPVAAEPAAPPSEVTLVLERNQRPLLRLAFPAFQGLAALPPEAREAARELQATLRNDLEEARIFAIQGPDALAAFTPTGNRTTDLEGYRSLGNELLLEGEVSLEPNKVVFDGRVFDLASGQLILGKRYRGEYRVARRVAHTFADEVILYFTGKRGLGLTTIAFHSDRSGEKEIYLVDYDGADPRRVTGHRSVSLFPSFTPDGSGLAYVSFLNGTPAVYVADLTTGRKRPVLTEGRLNSSPSFSPDGQRLVFVRALEGNPEIFIAGADGSGARRLTFTRAVDSSPSFSPNGNEIAFTSSRSGQPDIWVMDAEGTNLQKISSDGTYNDGAAWSPDGTQLAYASRRDGVFQIVVTDRVTLQTQVLTSTPGDKESPTFSPDGRRIAFSWSSAGRAGKVTQIWVMDVDGKNARQLTREGNNYSPSWSGFPAR